MKTTRLVFVVSALAGCGFVIGEDFSETRRRDGAAGTGGSTASSDGEKSCDGSCVADDGGEDANSRDGSSGDSGPDRDSGPPILCVSYSGSGGCLCTTNPAHNPSGTEEVACSLASVGGDGGGGCCASNEWPAGGACRCRPAQANCHKTTDKVSCICSLVARGAGEESVASCTGTICCLQPDDTAPTCACHTVGDSCILGGTPVPSCSPSDVQCKGKSVTDCRAR